MGPEARNYGISEGTAEISSFTASGTGRVQPPRMEKEGAECCFEMKEGIEELCLEKLEKDKEMERTASKGKVGAGVRATENKRKIEEID